MHYCSFDEYAKTVFGTKVYKLSLSTGCTCPTRDGKLGTEGCSFCSAGGSGEFATPFEDIDVQIEKAKLRVDKKIPKSIPKENRKYIAYFQSFTNTYAPVEYLKPIFLKAAKRKDIVAISIATRPDCIPKEILDLLIFLNQIKPVWVELGLQTIHKASALAFGRGYSLELFEDSYLKLKNAGLYVIVHIILFLPNESKSDMLKTIDYLAQLSPRLDGIKIQLLQILRGTKMANQYQKEAFYLPTLDEYCEFLAECLKRLPKEIVIHRITGDGPKKLLIAPAWCANKRFVLNYIKSYLEKQNL